MGLVTGCFQAGVEHAVIQGAEMELADDDRSVGIGGQCVA
jgi:hypothetical protein